MQFKISPKSPKQKLRYQPRNKSQRSRMKMSTLTKKLKLRNLSLTLKVCIDFQRICSTWLGEDNEEPPSTAPISEHPITETDDQIPDYVLESSQASRISLPQPQQNEDERASVDSGAVQEAIEASIEAINEARKIRLHWFECDFKFRSGWKSKFPSWYGWWWKYWVR